MILLVDYDNFYESCHVLSDYCMLSVFFFKQKTAYEMRISDWSSDVCSSDLWLQICPYRPLLQRSLRRRRWCKHGLQLSRLPVSCVTARKPGPTTMLASVYSVQMKET